MTGILRTRKLTLASLLGGLALVVAGTQAQAGFTVTLDSTTPSGSNTQYNYTATIPADDVIVSGDFFRIYDFGGYVAGSITAPAGWAATVQLTTSTPPPNVILSHGDDPAIFNLIYTYTGSTITGPSTIPGFSAVTTVNGPTVIKDFVGRDTKGVGDAAGSKVDSIGTITVPAAVPEPSSLISCSLGVIALGFLYARRNRRRMHAIA